MISVADLIKNNSFKGNYFSPEAYIQSDLEFGLIENCQGSRLIALPEVLLQGIYSSLEDELGDSAGVVLFNCGRWWGKNFYRRFVEEVSQYYGQPLAQMEAIEFWQSWKQCWKTHGWGTIEVDLDYYQQGFLVFEVFNSAFAQATSSAKRPMCFAEAGILSSFFSQLTGQSLHCLQTACESMGAKSNYFILGLSTKLEPAEKLIAAKQDHQSIMKSLCN
jgi:uncharacterized protein